MDVASICQNLCEQNGCELIFCSEFGSRSFGYANEDSDYDIRGIYIRKDVKYYKYLAFVNYKLVDSKNDMIVSKIDNKDIELWDFRKVIALFYSNCNQAPVSWLTMSNIVYFKTDRSDRLKEFILEKNEQLPKGILSHYFGVAYASLQKYKRRNEIKHYIYSHISILLAEWFLKYQIVPDMSKYKDELSEMRKNKEVDVDKLESRLQSLKLLVEGMKNDKFTFDDAWENIIDLIIN